MAKKDTEIKVEKSLVPLEKYLESGVHIGSKYKSGHMRKFIYKIRNDGLCVLDVNELNKRLSIAAKFLAQFEPSDILVVAGRNYAQKPAKVFAETIGAKYIIGRFIPGTLTNHMAYKYIDADLILISDPRADRQALKEATIVKIPIIALCDTDNNLANIDLAIPANNRGRKSLALVFYLLAREVLLERGEISSREEFQFEQSDFFSSQDFQTRYART